MTDFKRQKPGAPFEFKLSSTIDVSEPPDFSKSPRKSHKTDNILSAASYSMVNKQAAPTADTQSARTKTEGIQRPASPDSDTDVTALVSGFATLKPAVQKAAIDRSSQHATERPQFGHPTKMMSSRKQNAGIFIKQKSRPEHHLNPHVSGPKPPSYHDRKPQPLPMFNSNQPRTAPVRQIDEVFYTDPTKANADLKALLEGGMEDEDEDEPNEPSNVDIVKSDSAGKATQKEERPRKVGKDGSVESLKVRLLPHQVEGVEWMRGRELGPVKRGTVPKGGLLADDMGLGKTLQTISLLLLNPKPDRDAEGWQKHFEKVQKTTLVIAPLALIRQWEQEIKDKVTKSNGLKVLVHHGPQRTKKAEDLALYDVVVTTYQILVSDHAHSTSEKKFGCFSLHWWRVVLDEAHTIKNRMAKTTKACYELQTEYRWCLSGTPMQNNLDELQSLVRFLRIKPYDDIRQWKAHIDQPLKNGKGHITISRLHSILRCFMKRRTKDILKEEGALYPGGKQPAEEAEEGEGPSPPSFKPTERKVVTVSAEFSAPERYFYGRLEERTDMRVQAMMREKLSYASAFTLLLRLRQVCNHPKLVEGKLEKDKDALSTDFSQKTQDTSLDAVADMFSGMDIGGKKCVVCYLELSAVDLEVGHDTCAECLKDRAYFETHAKVKAPKNARSKPKAKTILKTSSSERRKESKQDSLAHTGTKRRQRNRKAVIESDDEDDEGSWLVGEGQRTSLKLGIAGGDEDENLEGSGDWIGTEDSSDDSNGQNRSNLSSFVVDADRPVEKHEEHPISNAADDDEDGDSLLSIAALTKQMASQTINDDTSRPVQAPAAGSYDANGTLSVTSESESGIDESELYSSADESVPERGTSRIVASAKIREITRIINAEAQEHKFIIFSQFTSMLDLIEPFLRKEGVKFTRYDGSMRNDTREESLRQLRENRNVRVLLCSLKCGSLGLNLTAATRVIIVEPFWNPFVEEQAIDRVHRLTQTVDVVVYKLTVADTVEARIIDLQEKKRLLAKHTIEGGSKKNALKLGLNELIDLFKPGGHHASGGDGDLDIAGSNHSENVMRVKETAALNFLSKATKKPAIGTKTESSIYGRRW